MGNFHACKEPLQVAWANFTRAKSRCKLHGQFSRVQRAAASCMDNFHACSSTVARFWAAIVPQERIIITIIATFKHDFLKPLVWLLILVSCFVVAENLGKVVMRLRAICSFKNGKRLSPQKQGESLPKFLGIRGCTNSPFDVLVFFAVRQSNRLSFRQSYPYCWRSRYRALRK
jgi:hypothetical protein